MTSALLVSLLNVFIVIAALLLALYLGSRRRPYLWAMSAIGFGVLVYAYEAFRVISDGTCTPGDTLLDFLVGVSDCLGLGDRMLGHAQIAILGGVLVLAFTPLLRMVTKDQEGDQE